MCYNESKVFQGRAAGAAGEGGNVKHIRKLTILLLTAALFCSVSFAAAFAADGEAGAPQFSARTTQEPLSDEGELSLLLPETYEQYLDLSAPSSVAATDDYIAVADGNTIYLYDRVNGGPYRTYTYSDTSEVESLNFYEHEGTVLLYFTANLGSSTPIMHIDCLAENFSDQTPERTAIVSCSSFVITGDYVCYADAQNYVYLTTMNGTDITAPSSDSALNSSNLPVNTPAFAVHDGTIYFSLSNTIYTAGMSSGGATMSQWLTVSHTVSSFAVIGSACYYSAAGRFYRRAETQDGYIDLGQGTSVRLCDDGRLYVTNDSSIREFSASGEAFTGYEIARYSSSTNRLGENAADISARSGALLIADTANDRVLQYKDGAYTVLCSADSPTLVCAGDDTFAVYGNSSVSVYTDGGQTVQTYTVRGAVGLAYAYGTFYCVTSANETWAIPADGGSPSEGTLALGSSAAQDLTADVYGRLYVFSGDGNVYRFTADEFLNPGTNLESVAIFSDSVHSVHCAYDGTLYGVSDQSLFVWRESSAAETSLNLSDLVTTPSAAAADLSFDFESGKLYILSDGFIAQGNFDIPSLSNISADGLHDALSGDAASAEELLVEVPAQSVILSVAASSVGEATAVFPYAGYARTDSARTGIKICDVAAGTVVAFYEYRPAPGSGDATPTRDYTLCLVLGGEEAGVSPVATENYYTDDADFAAHNSSEVSLYRFPSMNLGDEKSTVARLSRGTSFTVHGYVRFSAETDEGGWGLDSDYAYVTVDATGQSGYIPAGYVVAASDSGSGTSEFVFRNVARGESITLYSGSASLTLSDREQVRQYGAADENGNVYVTYTDENGTVWSGTVPESALYEAPASATAVLVAVIAVTAVVLVSVCYLLLRRQPTIE